MPSGGIRTHDLSRRAAADLRLRPRGYCDRHTISNTDANCGDLRENKRARARKFMDVAKQFIQMQIILPTKVVKNYEIH